MSEHCGPLYHIVSLKGSPGELSFSPVSSAPMRTNTRTRLSTQGRAFLMREPSADYCVLFSFLKPMHTFQELSITDATSHVGDKKTNCCVNFRRRTQGTPYRSLLLGSATDEDSSTSHGKSTKMGVKKW
jgi:hypothetical protein